MAACKNSARPVRVLPDFPAVLGRFSDALAVITVAHRALRSVEIAGNEESALGTGLCLLRAVYNELDAAVRP